MYFILILSCKQFVVCCIFNIVSYFQNYLCLVTNFILWLSVFVLRIFHIKILSISVMSRVFNILYLIVFV